MSSIRKYLQEIPKEEIIKHNEMEIERAEKDFIAFKEHLSNGLCYYCKKNIDTFDLNTPCFHWLLRPKGLKKKYIIEFLSKAMFDYFQISSYLRWLANTELWFAHIKDGEKEMGYLFQITIKYRNIEWSLSSAMSDYNGHTGTNCGFPHYHLQMLIDNQIFIKFGELHIPFTQDDLFTIRAQIEAPDLFEYREGFGASIENVMEELSGQELLDTLRTAPDESKEAVHITSVIQSNDKPIPGDVIQGMIDEHRKTGIPLSKLFQKLDVSMSTIISPGKAVPNQKTRPPRKKRDS